MALNLISRGIIMNFLINLIIVFLLIHYRFELSERIFTILLNGNLLLISMHIGASSKKAGTSAQINGLFVGLGSALIVFLFLSQFVSLNWEINALLLTVWMFFGYIGGFFGSKMVRKPVQA